MPPRISFSWKLVSEALSYPYALFLTTRADQLRSRQHRLASAGVSRYPPSVMLVFRWGGDKLCACESPGLSDELSSVGSFPLNERSLQCYNSLSEFVSSSNNSCEIRTVVPPRSLQSRGVAQPGRAPGSGPGGRRFKSSLPDHLFPVQPGDMGYRMYRSHG